MGAGASTSETVKKAIQHATVRDIEEIKGDLRAVNVALKGLDERFDRLIEQLYPSRS